jgi:hypothetical protein
VTLLQMGTPSRRLPPEDLDLVATPRQEEVLFASRACRRDARHAAARRRAAQRAAPLEAGREAHRLEGIAADARDDEPVDDSLCGVARWACGHAHLQVDL